MAPQLYCFSVHRILYRSILMVMITAVSLLSLEIRMIPAMSPIITNPSLGEMDLFGEGFGPPMFIISLNNAGDTATYKNLHIRYTVILEYTEKGVQRTQRLYEGITDGFSIFPNEVLTISSTNFFNSNNSDNRVALKYMVYELDDLRLKNQLVSSKRIPDGTLTLQLELSPAVDPIVEDNFFSYTVMNTTSIDLIAPGYALGSQPADVRNPLPHFSWVSELYPGIYSSDDVFELRIFEARPGVNASEALARPPFFSQKINAYTFQYPANSRPLVPGYTYYWQVIGFVKGAFTSEIKSDVFGFRLEPLVDSTALMQPKNIDEVLEILRPVIGDKMVEELSEYVSGTLLLDNDPISRERLSELVRGIIAGKYTAEEPSLQ